MEENKVSEKLIKDVAASIKVIESESEAKAYLDQINKENEEIASLPPAEQKLRREKQLQNTFAKMDKIWKSLSRKRKRKIMDKSQKKSNQIRKRLRK